MVDIRQTDTFKRWRSGLKDHIARAAIATRLTRLAHGLTGDAKSVGNGVFELRIHIGPGYRIYFMRKGPILIILLCGGDKSSQARDIETAKNLANEVTGDGTKSDPV